MRCSAYLYALRLVEAQLAAGGVRALVQIKAVAVPSRQNSDSIERDLVADRLAADLRRSNSFGPS